MMKNIKFDFGTKPVLTIEDFDLKLRKNGDFWRAHLDYQKEGMNHELGIYSHQQNPCEIIKERNEITIIYDSLIAEDKSQHNIKISFKISQADGALHFSANMVNNSNVRLNELQYPFFEFNQINGPLSCDELITPDGLGKKIINPHQNTACAHTEYMAADYKNIWNVFSYPGQFSMPWMGVHSKDKYLYFGCHSKKWRMLSFVNGIEPRGAEEEYFICAISSYPALRPGESIVYDDFILAGFDTDWREGVDFYRLWADRAWNKPAPKAGIKNIMGWQRIILKHQYGEIFHTYDELPKIYKEGAKYGINMILLFAWWKEGMDNGYPNYEPDPALGGAEKLKEAIREINALGGIVILYANGHLIDVATDYYKNEGIKYTMKDIELNEYREFYKFSNNGTLLKSGHKTFAAGCYGTKEWRKKLVEIEKKHLALGSNGTFFDQIGICFNFCFDDTHEHGNRIDEEPDFRLETVKQMKEILNDNEYFGTEWTVDRLSAQMDFIHGCGFGQFFSEDAYPYIFRYAFPNVLISNRFIHDEKQGWKRHLNYTFTFGLIFDVSIYRGRADSINVVPKYAAYVKNLIGLRKNYIEFFTNGKFNLPNILLPDGVKGAEYSLAEKKIMTVWNDSDKAVEVCGKTIPAQNVDVIELR